MKRLTSIFLVLAMLLTLVPMNIFAAEAENTVFSDMKETDYYAQAATALEQLDILAGYPDGTFGAEKSITRAEMAAIVCRMIDKETDAEKAKGETIFDDVSSDHWASGYINIASKEGIINGDGNGKFRPEDDVKHEEAIKMVVCALGYGDDVEVDAKDWSKGYLEVADEKGISADLKGTKGKASTRGDVAVMSYNGLATDAENAKIPATPVASKEAGEYKGTQKVKLSTTTKDAEIYYTTDGTTPTAKSTKYTKEISISKTSTLKAIAVKNGVVSKGIMSADYTIKKVSSGGGGGGSSRPSTPVTPPNPDDTKTYTRGEWVQLLAEKLGMNLDADTSSIDYYYVDVQDSEYGIAIETSQRYGILPPPEIEDLDQDIPYFYPNEVATREFAAYTAVKAMGFDGTNSFDLSSISDYSETKYPEEIAIAIGYNFLATENNKVSPQKSLTGTDAKKIFEAITALNESIEVTAENAHDSTEYVENIVRDELEEVSSYNVIESLSNEDTYTVSFPKSDVSINVGDVIILPANETYISGFALKVTNITEDDTDIFITGVEPELAEVFSHIDFAGNGTAVVGNLIPADGVSCEYNENGSVDEDNSELYPLDIDLGGSVPVPGTLKFTVAEKKFTDYLKASGSVEIEIPAVTCIVDAHIGFTNTTVNEFTLSIQEKIKFKGELKCTLAESGYELTNSLGNTRFEKGRIELGRLPFALGTTGLSFDIVFFYNVEAKGSASITYTIVSTQGYQYKNGTSRAIFDFDDSLDFLEIKGSAKAGLGIAADLCAFKLMDLVGYSIEGGIAFNASFTPHILATDTLFCGDVTLYAYCTSGLDKETALGVFLDKVCHYTLEFEHLKNNSSNPHKLKLHIENGRRVSECTFGMGGISGYVASLDSNASISNARVNIYDTTNNDLIRTLYTDSQGKYNIDNLSSGDYKIVVSATGYFTYEVIVKVQATETTYVENLLMIDRNGTGAASLVEGNIKDAVTGYGISGTSYNIRSGWNVTSGEAVASGTFDNDTFSLSLGVGNYTLEVSKEGYVTNYINIAVSENACSNANIALSPENINLEGDSVRIVLTWGDTPNDLDSHLFGPANGGGTFHLYYPMADANSGHSNREYYTLDLDDTSSYGPETTTIHKLEANGLYSFYVHDFTNLDSSTSDAMSKSGAKVQVYVDNVKIATFNIPANQAGTVWHVFDYNAETDEIIPVNTFAFSSNSGTLEPMMLMSASLDDEFILNEDMTSVSEEEAIRIISNCTEK